jgi:hypothetical protein
MVCLKSWADYYVLVYTHCQELMKSAGSHGSFVTSIHDEVERLTLCERLLLGYDHIHCHDTFKVLWWGFLCDLIDKG